MVRVSVWVPKTLRHKLLEFAEKLREVFNE